MNAKRCDSIVLQIVVTEYDEQGRPVGEQTSQPVKVFRANAADFWAEVDKSVNAVDNPPTPKVKRR